MSMTQGASIEDYVRTVIGIAPTGAAANGTNPDNPNMPPHAFHSGRTDGACGAG